MTSALRSGRRMAPMTALVHIDVTDAWQRIKDADVSPTAFVLACVGRAVAAHPEVHAYRDWFGRLVIHRAVNITTMVEVESSTGVFPLAHPVSNTAMRSVSDISAELRTIKETPSKGRSGMMMQRWGRVAGWIPGFASLVYFVARRTSKVRSEIGTVAVSSVGMMTGGGGFAVGVMTMASPQVIVGGAVERPWVLDGEVVVRRILDLTMQIDHRVVDGAPAARFGATLRELLENPDLVDW
ncbi:MAG: 2-oxo acid dehydrogenase subunit E2 [Acidimicrobiia bacterium]|nr:2-oxo acid dehydrogenase subunit E2 [Acidimicrobiia bacterium]